MDSDKITAFTAAVKNALGSLRQLAELVIQDGPEATDALVAEALAADKANARRIMKLQSTLTLARCAVERIIDARWERVHHTEADGAVVDTTGTTE